jgi:tripartite-type tricarboxylate transporter receptor subunit TctC
VGAARAELPTIAESAYPGFDTTSWNGLFAPAGAPEPMIARLAGALRHATADPRRVSGSRAPATTP